MCGVDVWCWRLRLDPNCSCCVKSSPDVDAERYKKCTSESSCRASRAPADACKTQEVTQSLWTYREMAGEGVRMFSDGSVTVCMSPSPYITPSWFHSSCAATSVTVADLSFLISLVFVSSPDSDRFRDTFLHLCFLVAKTCFLKAEWFKAAHGTWHTDVTTTVYDETSAQRSHAAGLIQTWWQLQQQEMKTLETRV